MNMMVLSCRKNTSLPCCLKNFNFEILFLDIVCLHVLCLEGKFQKAFVGR